LTLGCYTQGAASVAPAHLGQKEEQMSIHYVNECGYCGSSIVDGQRWVREKIVGSAGKNGGEPKYKRYHAEVSAGDRLSCWEQHLMQLEMERATPRAA
jgi:hypothetical protein